MERGPLVYCAEFADNSGSVFNLSLPESASFKIKESTDFLPGIRFIEASGKKYHVSSDNQTIKEEDVLINFIPYYSRAYRGAGEMKVWLPMNGEQIKANLQDDLRIVDEVIIGNNESEKGHNLQSENSRSDQSVGWRDADNGWFSYDLEVLPDKLMELVLTYHSTDGGNRYFEILIDNKKIAEKRLRTETFDILMDQAYLIPEEMTKGKETITVKIQSLPGNIAGGIFGCKTKTIK